jgi:hypothetical protein
MPFLDWLQNTQLATWISQSDSVWVYPSVLSMHTIGLGVLVGIGAAVDLRILGFASRVPLAPLERFFPIMWAGFWINAVSGTALFAAAATTKGTQWIFYVKLLLVAIGVVHIRLLKSTVFGNPASLETGRASVTGRVLAATSLATWLGAIVTGRLMAYY